MSHTFDLALRFWEEMIARPKDSMAFRFVLQPAVATALAIRDGIKDAHLRRTPYIWTMVHDPAQRRSRLLEGIEAVSRVLVLAAIIDILYQLIELHGLRPLETVVVAVTLAFLPYLLVRGPALRVTRRILQSRRPQARPGQ